jgi:hypothetical protein
MKIESNTEYIRISPGNPEGMPQIDEEESWRILTSVEQLKLNLHAQLIEVWIEKKNTKIRTHSWTGNTTNWERYKRSIKIDAR